MTLDAAIKEFEALFASVRSAPADTPISVIWSGGQRTADETAPALYATRDMALEAWVSTARSWACVDLDLEGTPLSAATLEWVLKPELIAYQITMADLKQRHRVVADRYAVKSQFRVVEK